MAKLDFWYSIGSTYSYLTILRIEAAAEAAGVTVTWRPFNVRAIMVAQNNVPFRDKPVKTAYMWRDIGRRAARLGLRVPALPAPYPLRELELANSVALLDMREGWGRYYTIQAYRRWFLDGDAAAAASRTSRAASPPPVRIPSG